LVVGVPEPSGKPAYFEEGKKNLSSIEGNSILLEDFTFKIFQQDDLELLQFFFRPEIARNRIQNVKNAKMYLQPPNPNLQ